jgi:hypothetical protein
MKQVSVLMRGAATLRSSSIFQQSHFKQASVWIKEAPFTHGSLSQQLPGSVH